MTTPEFVNMSSLTWVLKNASEDITMLPYIEHDGGSWVGEATPWNKNTNIHLFNGSNNYYMNSMTINNNTRTNPGYIIIYIYNSVSNFSNINYINKSVMPLMDISFSDQRAFLYQVNQLPVEVVFSDWCTSDVGGSGGSGGNKSDPVDNDTSSYAWIIVIFLVLIIILVAISYGIYKQISRKKSALQ
jgi:hypothetical protein